MCEDRSVQIAWAAGLFEGEGCWRIRRRDDKVTNIVATLASTDRDVVEKFAQIVGFGSIRIVQPPNPRAKTQYCWDCARRNDVKDLAEWFLPYLGERRGARAVEILATPDLLPDRKQRTHCPHGHPYDNENTYWYVKDGYNARACKTCRAVHNSPEEQRRRRILRKAAQLSSSRDVREPERFRV